jgi:hypothetical protein
VGGSTCPTPKLWEEIRELTIFKRIRAPNNYDGRHAHQETYRTGTFISRKVSSRKMSNPKLLAGGKGEKKQKISEDEGLILLL